MTALPIVGGDSGNWGTILNGYLNVAHNANGTLKAIFSVEDYGATGDGITDDSSAIQSAIDAAHAAVIAYGASGEATAEVVFPAKHFKAHGLSLPGNVHLKGNGARITANASGVLITIYQSFNRISQMYLQGGGVGVGASGVMFASGSRWSAIEFCRFDQFAGRAIYTASGSVANWIERILTQNCLLDTGSISTYTGVVELAGTDHWMDRCEITASRTSISSANLYCVAVMLNGANHSISNTIGEISDMGFYISTNAIDIRMTNCRADLNRGHGIKVDGGSGCITGCEWLSNSQETTNTYDSWTATAGNFQVTGCLATTHSATLFRYGFIDTQNSGTSFNAYVNCFSRGGGAGRGFFTANFAGARVHYPDNPSTGITVNATTFNVDQYRNLYFQATGSVAFTNFTSGLAGQRITVRGDGNTTIQNNTNIKNASGADILTDVNKLYSYQNINSVWYQD